MKHKLLLPIMGIILWLQPISAQEPEDGKDLLGQAAEAMRQNQFLKAETIYRTLVMQNPDDLAMKHLLCHALMNRKQFRECDSLLNEVYKLDTNNIGTHWYQALSANRKKDDTLAFQLFEKYIQKFKSSNMFDKKAYLQAGSALRRIMHDSGITAAQVEKLQMYYQNYIELLPTDPYAVNLQEFLDKLKTHLPLTGEKLIWKED